MWTGATDVFYRVAWARGEPALLESVGVSPHDTGAQRSFLIPKGHFPAQI
jgi:hypothetical protein